MIRFEDLFAIWKDKLTELELSFFTFEYRSMEELLKTTNALVWGAQCDAYHVIKCDKFLEIKCDKFQRIKCDILQRI